MKHIINNHISRNKKEYLIILTLLVALTLIFPLQATKKNEYQGELDLNYVEKNVTKPKVNPQTYFKNLREKSRLAKLDKKVKELGIASNFHRKYKQIKDYERCKISDGTKYVIYNSITKTVSDKKYRNPKNKKLHVYKGKSFVANCMIMKSHYFRVDSSQDDRKFDTKIQKQFKKQYRTEKHYYWFCPVGSKVWQLPLALRVRLDEKM